jgi:hypothetical protein
LPETGKNCFFPKLAFLSRAKPIHAQKITITLFLMKMANIFGQNGSKSPKSPKMAKIFGPNGSKSPKNRQKWPTVSAKIAQKRQKGGHKIDPGPG